MPFRGTGHPLTGTTAGGSPDTVLVLVLSILLAVMAVTPVLIFWWHACGCPRPDRARRRYRRDMRSVRRRGMACASCKGENTALRRVEGRWACRDRDLCRASVIYASMLEAL